MTESATPPPPRDNSTRDNSTRDNSTRDNSSRDNRTRDNKTRDGAVVEKVRALLRKAESSDFPEEADALLAKAQELIARHALEDDALGDLYAQRLVDHDEIPVRGSYTYERAAIWSAVAAANRCRLISHKVYGSRKVTALSLIGRETDREITKILSLSLEHQALRRLPDSLPQDQNGSLVRRRRSFLLGFAGEVSRRLTAANQSVEGHEQASTRSLALRDELDDYVQSFGQVRADRSRTSIDPSAYDDGLTAANVADLGQARLRRQQRQLNR